MANLIQYLTVKYTRMIGEISNDLGVQLDKTANLQNIIQALKNHDILFDGGPLTLDRIQAMEDGSFRILPIPPMPAETCIEEISKQFGTKNGKKEGKETEDIIELVESQVASVG